MTFRMTAEQVEAHRKRIGLADEKPEVKKPRETDRYRSELERRYAALMQIRIETGSVRSFNYESIKLRLPGGVFYTPDFSFVNESGEINLAECKGFMRESARNKLRAAVELYPEFVWWIVGQSLSETRLLRPEDVPAIRKGVA